MLDSLIEINHIRIILAIAMLGIASYNDITKREVSDFLWIVFGVAAIALIFFEPNMGDSLILVGISLIIAPFSLIIWRFGMIGGADAFALIVLAALAPQITLSENTVTTFTVLTNAVVISVVPLFVNFFRNLFQMRKEKDIFEGFEESRNRRILAMFIGYKAKNPKYSFSIEKKVGKNKKLNLKLQHAEYAEFCDKPNTWVTPGVPYMLFITAGFLIQLFYGDIIFNLFGLGP